MIEASAPGKAVLAGEYAVLKGAPAIVAGIDRRARVCVSRCNGGHHELTTPGYLDGTWQFRQTKDGNLEWLERLPDPATFSLFETVWQCFDNKAWPPLSISIDTLAFHNQSGESKLGLGSSAAVTVSLTAALLHHNAAGNYTHKSMRDLVFGAHSRFQGGRGSGVDIAASLDGGLLRYQRGLSAWQSLPWPKDLHYGFLWSGRAAITAEKLAMLYEQPAAKTASSMVALGAAAAEVAAAWSASTSAGIMDAMQSYVHRLRQFSVDLELGIFDAGHAQLVDLAADCGIVYKPCGAGGGDIGVVLAEHQSAIDDFGVLAEARGFSCLDIGVDTQGVLTTVRQDLE